MLADVAVIGTIPQGLSGFSNFFPYMTADVFPSLLQGAVSIAIIGFMETIAMAGQGVHVRAFCP
jgi:hypothetical protein